MTVLKKSKTPGKGCRPLVGNNLKLLTAVIKDSIDFVCNLALGASLTLLSPSSGRESNYTNHGSR